MDYHKEKFLGEDILVEDGMKLGLTGRVIILGKWMGFSPIMTGLIVGIIVFILITIILLFPLMLMS